MSGKEIFRDFMEPEEALVIARREVAEFDFTAGESLASYFPSLEVSDIEYEIGEVNKDDGVIADWRSFNGQATSDKFGHGGKLRGGLQPIARNYTIDEYKKLKARRDSDNVLHTRAEELVRRAARAIARSVNVQRYNALVNAKVNIDGPNGLHEEVSFNRRPEFDTTAPVLFNDDSADPLEFIAELCDQYQEANGFRPAEIWVPAKIRRRLFSHPVVVEEAAGDGQMSTRRILPQSYVQALLDDWNIPTLKDAPTETYKYNDFADGGAEKTAHLFPQDSILLVPESGDPGDPLANPYGRTFWGETVSSELPEFQGATSELGAPGIVAAVYKEGWPFTMEVIADALAMPVVISPDYTLKAKVI